MKKIFPLIFIVIFSCKSKQEITDVKVTSDNETLEISIEQNDNISFTLKNISEGPIYIYDLGKLNIEKYEESSWQKLKILPCPCDAPCHPGREMEQLLAGETFILLWNKQESWCGEKKQGLVRETIKQGVDVGKYRILVNFSTDKTIKKACYKEFEIQRIIN
jgi:hypothetical protein